MARIIEPLLGTRAEIEVVAASGPTARTVEDAIEAAVLAEVARLEDIFTVFRPASALQRYRASGTTESPELQEVIGLAAHWHRRSAGFFHPGVQPIVDRWDRYEQTQTPPDHDELAQIVATLDPAGGRALNLSGIAKGWIAEHALVGARAAQNELHSEPVNAWLSLGGDIVHRGPGTLVAGIEDPHRPYDNVAPFASIELSNEALATSGVARRYWTIEGHSYAKVLDPRTGWPVEDVASATVVAPDAATADVLATIALIMPTEEFLGLARSEGAACFLVQRDGAVISSSDRFVRPS